MGHSSPTGLDARVQWDLAVNRLKKALMEEKKRVAGLKGRTSDAVTNLQLKRQEVASYPSAQEVADVVQLEAEAKANKLLEAEVWRRRSRVCWLSLGDAPSRYFFLQMKAKQSRETIKTLAFTDGTMIEDEKQILEETCNFFSSLFQADDTFHTNMGERADVLFPYLGQGVCFPKW